MRRQPWNARLFGGHGQQRLHERKRLRGDDTTGLHVQHALQSLGTVGEDIDHLTGDHRVHRDGNGLRQAFLAGELGELLLRPGEEGEAIGPPLELAQLQRIAKGERNLRGELGEQVALLRIEASRAEKADRQHSLGPLPEHQRQQCQGGDSSLRERLADVVEVGLGAQVLDKDRGAVEDHVAQSGAPEGGFQSMARDGGDPRLMFHARGFELWIGCIHCEAVGAQFVRQHLGERAIEGVGGGGVGQGARGLHEHGVHVPGLGRLLGPAIAGRRQCLWRTVAHPRGRVGGEELEPREVGIADGAVVGELLEELRDQGGDAIGLAVARQRG